MKKNILILLLLLTMSCKTSKQEKEFDIPNLKENINKFIKSKRCFDKSSNFLIVNLGVRSDSLQVEIADTYPNIKAEKFQFDTVLFGSRVIFTGEKIKGFAKNSLQSDFPPDIVRALKANPGLTYEEFTAWVFLYQKGNLIYQERPCADRK